MLKFSQFIFHHFSKRPFRLLYNVFVPRVVRKKWQFIYDEMPRQQKVASFWQEALYLYQKNQINKYEIKIKRPELIGKKIIWQYWDSGLDNLPEVAKLCFASVDKHCQDYQIFRLTNDTIGDFLKLPDFLTQIKYREDFRPAFFADILRTALLKSYGGVWLDASIFVSGNLPESYTNYDFFVYSRCQNSPNKYLGRDNTHFYFNWDDSFKVRHLNSIIFAKANGKLISIILDMLLYFWQKDIKVQHYFFYQILLNELQKSYSDLFNFPVVDDTLPHLLQSVIKKPVSEDGLGYIKEQCPLHKLSIYNKPKSKTLTGLTYYGYLLKDEFG